MPRDKTLYLVGDGPGVADASVMLHEFVHALQDEHFDLGPRLRSTYGSADAVTAMHALSEGDATFAVLVDANMGSPIDEVFLSAFVRGLRDANRKSAGAGTPDSIADAVSLPYVLGTIFVWFLYEHGGWPAVNRAWTRPPRTTEQLLHPAKYQRQEGPLPWPRMLRAPRGFALHTRESFGELDVRTWLGVFLGSERGETLASGWGNGAWELFTRGDERLVRLRIRWDGDQGTHARDAHDELMRSFTDRYGAPTMTGSVAWFERPRVGPIGLERRAGAPHEFLVFAGVGARSAFGYATSMTR